MEKKQIDWSSIGFGYIPTEKRYVSNYKDGKWDDGITDKNEEKMIKEITKDLERLQKTLDSYEYV